MEKSKTIKGILACTSAATFFFYSMVLLTLFNSISTNLTQFYSISDVQLGFLSAAFLLSNALFIIPNSTLLDNLDVRKIALLYLALCVVPCFLFTLSNNFWFGILLRFIQGFGCTISLLVGIKMATDWFPKHSATGIGSIVAFGMSGGFFSNIFLPMINNAIGWQKLIWLCGGVGILFLILMFFFFRTPKAHPKSSIQIKKIIDSIKKLFINLQLWKVAFFVGLINTPIYVLASLWGNRYLQAAKSFNVTQASVVSSMLFLGLIIGAPLLGWFSDFIGSRKKPMVAGALLSLIVIIPMILIQDLNYYVAILGFFMIGFLISTQSVGYPAIVESTSASMASTANGIGFFVTNAVGAFSQPLFGFLIAFNLLPNQSGGNYFTGMLMFPIAFIICLILALWMKETLKQKSK